MIRREAAPEASAGVDCDKSRVVVWLTLYRLFPYGVTVGSLLVLFIIIMLILIGQKRLVPNVVLLGTFILLVLFITGLIETAIQLFGPAVSSFTHSFFFSDKNPPTSKCH